MEDKNNIVGLTQKQNLGEFEFKNEEVQKNNRDAKNEEGRKIDIGIDYNLKEKISEHNLESNYEESESETEEYPECCWCKNSPDAIIKLNCRHKFCLDCCIEVKLIRSLLKTEILTIRLIISTLLILLVPFVTITLI